MKSIEELIKDNEIHSEIFMGMVKQSNDENNKQDNRGIDDRNTKG